MTRGNEKSTNTMKRVQMSIEASMDLLAGKWRALIIWHLIKEDLRFFTNTKNSSGISKKK